MRIACPSCAATYEVPAARLKPGKLVRCARCGGNWLPEAEAAEATPPSGLPETPVPAPAAPAHESPPVVIVPEATAPDVTAPELTGMDRLAAVPPPPRASRARLIGAWVLTAAVLVGAVAAIIGWRDAVVRAWPPSSRILATSEPAGTAKGGQTPHPAQPPGKNVE